MSERTEVNVTMPQSRKVQLRERTAEYLAYVPGKRSEREIAKAHHCSLSEVRRALGWLYGKGRVVIVEAGEDPVWRLASDAEREHR